MGGLSIGLGGLYKGGGDREEEEGLEGWLWLCRIGARLGVNS